MEEESYSINTGSKRTFHAADYVLFALTLTVSASIGLFYAIKDRKKQDTEDFLLGGRKMHVIPVTLSLLSSFISAITLLGTPSEVYYYNTMYWYIPVGFLFTAMGASHIFIPIFYRLNLISCFQYLELRFSRSVRLVASLIYICHMTIYIAIVLYGPALALNAVTGLSLWGSIIAVGLVCTCYTTLGGMKAVLWTDTFQTLVIFGGLIAVLVKGAMVLGGFGEAWTIADRNGRIKFLEFDTSLTKRYTVWNSIIGAGISWCAIYGTNQAQVQRALSLPSLKKAQIAIWLNFPGMFAVISLVVMVGIVMYGFYSKCDPVSFGLITKGDQLLPLFTMDILGNMPGVPGLFLSCVFSGGLSSMSSGLNALSAVLLEDFVKPFCCPNISELRATVFSKVMVVAFGLLGLVLAFLVSQVGSIIQVAYVLFGVFGGPVFGVFTLGILFPWANKWGGLSGLLSSLILLMWVGLGSRINDVNVTPRSPLSTVGCNMSLIETTTTTLFTTVMTTTPEPSDTPLAIYKLAHMWYGATAVIIVVVVGLLVSFLTGTTIPSSLDSRLICPFFDIFCPYLPSNLRRRLRFGVEHKPYVSGCESTVATKLDFDNTAFRTNTDTDMGQDISGMACSPADQEVFSKL